MRKFPFVFFAALAISIRHPSFAQATRAERFTYSPWEMTTAQSDERIEVVEKLPNYERLRQTFAESIPFADPRWKAAPDPRAIGFRLKTGVPCREEIAYFFFRSTLGLPRGMDARDIRLSFAKFDDEIAVFANGQPTPIPQFDENSVPLGDRLHPGANSILVVLADWCETAELQEARFLALSEKGMHIAALPSDPPIPSDDAASDHSDDWLRPRRDGGNTAHSDRSLRLPLKEAWSDAIDAAEVRIWGDTVLARTGSPRDTEGTLIALDLPTGRELWCLPNVALGDVTEDGGAIVSASSRTPLLGDGLSKEDRLLALLDIRTGGTRWMRKTSAATGPLAAHRGIVYLSSQLEHADGGLTRLSVGDGSLIPTETAEGAGWGPPGFVEDQMLFGDTSWLYSLYAPDPHRGPKYYGGGFIAPLLTGDYVLTGGWTSAVAYERDGSRLKSLWSRGAGYDEPRCYAPVGASGAALIGLTMLDILTGKVLWSVGDAESDSGVVTAGGQVIANEIRPQPARRRGAEPPPARRLLVIRDAKTSRVLWESEAVEGKPLAASQGWLLANAGGRLISLR
jgi:outer membrane protein assembly factor BamB